MAVERLQKLLAHAGVASRRHAEELIVAGRVSVNGMPQTVLGARADPEIDVVTVDGVPIHRERYRYVALNKPAGVISAVSDDRGRPTVADLVAGAGERLYPVGRLDLDSEGLILLTNDGALTELLLHPRHEVEREYLVRIDRALGAGGLRRMQGGITEGGELLRCRTARIARQGDEDWLDLVLTGGRKRHIRRMLGVLERNVVTLRRVRIGPVGLGALEPGASRELGAEEVTALYASAKFTGQ